jgi:hypothetical protein
MLTLVAVVNAQEVGPTGLIVIGASCCVVAAFLCAAAFSARLRASLRWSDDGRGPRVSAAGAGAFAAAVFFLSIMFFAQAFAWPGVSRLAFWLVAVAMFVAIGFATRDYSRDRERI